MYKDIAITPATTNTKPFKVWLFFYTHKKTAKKRRNYFVAYLFKNICGIMRGEK